MRFFPSERDARLGFIFVVVFFEFRGDATRFPLRTVPGFRCRTGDLCCLPRLLVLHALADLLVSTMTEELGPILADLTVPILADLLVPTLADLTVPILTDLLVPTLPDLLVPTLANLLVPTLVNLLVIADFVLPTLVDLAVRTLFTFCFFARLDGSVFAGLFCTFCRQNKRTF